jgi:hypothetical protein
MPPQMDASRNGRSACYSSFFNEKAQNECMSFSGLRMSSAGPRMPTNPIGHAGPGGPPPPPSNPYRPGMPPSMSPSMNQTGARMYMTNSPGVRNKNVILLFTLISIVCHRSEVILHRHLFHTVYVFCADFSYV